MTLVPGTVLYERNLSGLYPHIPPNREKPARYGLTVGDVERVVERGDRGAPIGTTIGMTIEGRNRFSIYARELRSDREELRRVLVPVGESGGGGSRGTQGSLRPA